MDWKRLFNPCCAAPPTNSKLVRAGPRYHYLSAKLCSCFWSCLWWGGSCISRLAEDTATSGKYSYIAVVWQIVLLCLCAECCLVLAGMLCQEHYWHHSRLGISLPCTWAFHVRSWWRETLLVTLELWSSAFSSLQNVDGGMYTQHGGRHRVLFMLSRFEGWMHIVIRNHFLDWYSLD